MSVANNLVIPTGTIAILYFLIWSYNFQALLVVTLIVLVLKYILNEEREYKLPPGPISLPIIGILQWFILRDPDQYIADLHKKYGPVMAIQFGLSKFYFVSDYDLCKELGQHPDFLDRPITAFHRANSGLGIITNEGPIWKHQRRFMVQSLKDSGMGKMNMQHKILDELCRVMAEFDKYQGRSMLVHSILEKSTFNLISALAFNKQFDYEDPALTELVEGIDQNFKLYDIIDTLTNYWWLYPLTSMLEKKAFRNAEMFKLNGRKIIEEHKLTLDPDNPRDFIDLYLIEMSKEESDESKEYLSTFFEKQLISVMMDLFVAGTETSSTTIIWAILYMSHFPHVQEKVQKELDEVVGFERMPTMEDRPSLPYTIATLQEIERLASVGKASLPKANKKPAKFNGYTFPPDSILLLNLFAVHRDEKIWKDPQDFKPERFIDDNGKVFRPQHLMAFGSGKRVCPGESLARMEIFLYFASLLQRYTFRPAKDGDVLDLNIQVSLVRSPVPFQVRVIKRQ